MKGTSTVPTVLSSGDFAPSLSCTFVNEYGRYTRTEAFSEQRSTYFTRLTFGCSVNWTTSNEAFLDGTAKRSGTKDGTDYGLFVGRCDHAEN